MNNLLFVNIWVYTNFFKEVRKNYLGDPCEIPANHKLILKIGFTLGTAFHIPEYELVIEIARGS